MITIRRLFALSQLIIFSVLILIVSMIMHVLFLITGLLDLTLMVFSKKKLNGDDKFTLMSKATMQDKYNEIIDYCSELFV